MSQELDTDNVSTPTESLWIDGMDEENIGKMFGGEGLPAEQGEPAESSETPEAAKVETEAEESEEQAKTEEPEPESKEEIADSEEITLVLSSGETTLTGDQVCSLVEVGMQFHQNKEQIKHAFDFQQRYGQLAQILETDPQFVAYLKNYGNPQAPAPVKNQVADPYAGNAEVEQFRQMVALQAKEQASKELQDLYAPFVSEMEQLKAHVQAERAKAIIEPLKQDPDYNEVNAAVLASVGQAVQMGNITPQEAALVYQGLQNDPVLYKTMYDSVKAKHAVQPMTKANVTRKIIKHAPKLESSQTITKEAKNASFNKDFSAAIGTGDPEAIGRLLSY